MEDIINSIDNEKFDTTDNLDYEEVLKKVNLYRDKTMVMITDYVRDPGQNVLKNFDKDSFIEKFNKIRKIQNELYFRIEEDFLKNLFLYEEQKSISSLFETFKFSKKNMLEQTKMSK